MAMGRPRDFDVEKALDQALQVFWKQGYEGASLSDLTEAMGINRPSLYAAFGNKEDLFRKVLDRYQSKMAATCDALAQPTARAVVEKMLYGIADAQCDTSRPRGCLMINSAMACDKENESIRQELVTRRANSETALRERFQRAKAEGDLPTDSNPDDLARYIAAVQQGMAVQAASGASGDDLRAVAAMALRNWPA